MMEWHRPDLPSRDRQFEKQTEYRNHYFQTLDNRQHCDSWGKGNRYSEAGRSSGFLLGGTFQTTEQGRGPQSGCVEETEMGFRGAETAGSYETELWWRGRWMEKMAPEKSAWVCPWVFLNTEMLMGRGKFQEVRQRAMEKQWAEQSPELKQHLTSIPTSQSGESMLITQGVH